MLRSMTAHQLREWETFYELEPFGEDRRDQQLGRLYQLLLNVYRNTTSHPARFRLDECIPPPVGDLFLPSGVPTKEGWKLMKGVAQMMAASGPWTIERPKKKKAR
jgi:hypothetical protein